MITSRRHERLVRAGDVLATVGRWAVVCVAFIAACALAAGVGTLVMLTVIDIVGRWR